MVIGSLCVLDTRSRTFSDEERASLTELAALVDVRVASLTERRRTVRAELTTLAAGPALAELRESLGHVHAGTHAGLPALAAIRSYLDLSSFMLEGGSVSGAALLQGLDAARTALDEAEDRRRGGIRLSLRDLGSTAELTVSSAYLPDVEAASIASRLMEQLGDDPSISVEGADEGVRVAFSVLEASGATR